MTKILITGGGGYIGSNICKQLLENGYEIVVIDNFTSGFKQPLELLSHRYGQKKIRYYIQDIRNDLSFIFNKEPNIKAVIHLAGICSVNESMHDPYNYFSINTAGTNNLLNFMVKFGIKNIVFSSSCAIYGEAKQVLIDEDCSTIPTNPYGQSKLMSEQIIDWFGQTLNVNYIILRYFNVCGASEDGTFGDSKKPSVHLMQNAVRGAMGLEQFSLTCPEVNTPDKTPVRDYVDVTDLSEAHVKALKLLLQKKTNQYINLGTGKGNSVLEIIKTVQKITGSKLKIKKNTRRQGEYAQMVSSFSKAKKILSWKPKRGIEDSVKSLITWYTQKPNGWEK